MKATETYYENKIAKLTASVERVRELHKPANGPYDDVACMHCTNLADPGFETDITEPMYVEYPCPTIQALDGE